VTPPSRVSGKYAQAARRSRNEAAGMQMNNMTRPEQPDLGTGNSKLPEPDLDRKLRFAERAGISPRCLDNWLKQKRIPYIAWGKSCSSPGAKL
jgi:hypothetical protein